MKKFISTLFIILTLSSCDPFGFGEMLISSEKELKENFTKNGKEITELNSFFNSITPKDLAVYIEYKSDKLIDLKVYYYIKTPIYPVKALKKEMTIDVDHKVYEYATSIDEDYTIKAEDFKVPGNVKM